MTADTVAARGGSAPRRGVRLAINLGLGALIVLTAVISNVDSSSTLSFPRDIDFVPDVIAVVMALALAWRRRWPLPVFWVVFVAAILSNVSSQSSVSGVMAAAVAIFQIARTGRRSVAIAAAAGSTMAFGAILLVQSERDIAQILSGIAIIGFATAVGDAIHSRRALIDSITERAVRAEQTREEEALRRVTEERLRIARELHDAAAHQIAVINLQAGAATAALAGDRREDADRALGSIRSSAQSVLSEIAALLVVLRNSEDPSEALGPVRGLADVEALVTEFEEAGLRVAGHRAPLASRLSGATDIAAFKIAQEALTNAHKHGTASGVELNIFAERGRLHILATNDLGFGRDVAPMISGYGLTGVRERVTSVLGELQIETGPSSFTLDVRLPLIPESAQ